MTTNDASSIIEQVNKLGHKFEIISNIKSGKEATVYRVMLDNHLVAMKLYKNPDQISFKNTNEYLTGKFYKKPSERKAIAKNNKFAKKLKYKNFTSGSHRLSFYESLLSYLTFIIYL